jgi:outer membrane protein OmpA-like peptidoglycan-associated protein
MQSRILRIILALLIVIPSATSMNLATASSEPQINLCEAGKFGSLSGVLTRGAGAQINFIPQSSEATSFIGAVDPAEAQPFIDLAGSNMIQQPSRSSYDSAQASLLSVINSVNSNLLSTAIPLTGSSLGLQVIGSSSPGNFPSGVYLTNGAMTIGDGDRVKLVGGATDKFVFISTEAHNLGAGTTIELVGGAQAKNVYWIVGTFAGALTIGANSSITGNILTKGTVTIGAGARIKGRVLAGNTITYGANSFLDVLSADSTCLTTPTSPSSDSTTKTLTFTATTLSTATIGTSYSDSVTAVAKTGTTTNSGVTISYTVQADTPLPAGLALNTSGVVTGTPLPSAIVGSYNVTIWAASEGYTRKSQVYTFQLAAASTQKTIVFTDIALYDPTIGNFYTDFIAAATKIGLNLSSAAVTYFVDPSSLPIGLTLNPLNGIVSGTPISTARIGTYYGLISAQSAEYPTKSQYFAFQLNAAVSTEKTIAFTDTTLNDATIGTVYSDYVIAASKIGTGFNGAPITYSVEAGTPLPIGLTLNTSTGLVSGTPISSARIGTYTSIFWASSPGYQAQSLNYTFQTYASLTKSPNSSSPLQTSFGAPVNTLMMTALFANNSSALTSKNRSAIKTMATKMKTLKIATLTVAGYASANGKSGHLKLSIARAKSVAAVLASSGVTTKISIKGLGVLASTGTQSALALSRKAEIWVLQQA